jgi:membrane protein YdbS with pleckstrin-like domain
MATEVRDVVIKPSLVPFTWKGLALIALAFVLLAATFVFQAFLRLFSNLGLLSILASLGLAGLGFLMIVIGVVRRNMYTYQLTDSHILIKKQLLGRSIRSIPFASVSDVEVSQSLAGRLAKYGDLVPITKSGDGLVRGMERTENTVAEMTNVPNPDKVAAMIMTRVSMMAGVTVRQ